MPFLNGTRLLVRIVVGVSLAATAAFVVLVGFEAAPKPLPKFRAATPTAEWPIGVSLSMPASSTLQPRRIADRHCVAVILRADADLREKMPATVDVLRTDPAVKAIGAALRAYDALDPEAACSPEVRAPLNDYVGLLMGLSYHLVAHPVHDDASQVSERERTLTLQWVQSVEADRDAVTAARKRLEARIAAP
jgi:hypothetical protein